jgi:hypothetical protein
MNKLVVHAVHGTWPYGFWNQIFRRTPQIRPGQELPWFLSGSPFYTNVAADLGRDLEWVSYKWSGKNSFAARAEAANKLVDDLSLRSSENQMLNTSS